MEHAAGLLDRPAELTSATVVVRDNDLLAEITTAAGYRVSARIVPNAVRVSNQTVTVICDLPDGVKVSHSNGLFSFLIKRLDFIFGFRKRAAQRVPGISADGRRVEWSRELQVNSKLGAVLRGAMAIGVVARDARLHCKIGTHSPRPSRIG